MNAKTNSFFSSTGAELRALAAAGDTHAQDEIARRAAKAPKTVAALRSRGMDDAAKARIAAAKAARPQAAKAPAFTHTTEVAVPAKGRDSLAKVRAEFGPRLEAVEAATLALAALAKSQDEVLKVLVNRAVA